MAVTLDDVLARLDLVRRVSHGFMARCPAHNDPTPSLSLRVMADGFSVHCFGCGAGKREAYAAIGLPCEVPSDPMTTFQIAVSTGRGRAKRRGPDHSQEDQLRRLVAEIRADATTLGDCEEAWELLAEAAAHERVLWTMTA